MLGKLRMQMESILDNYVGKPLAKKGINPNTITMLSIPLALIAAYFIYLHIWSLALFFMAVSIFIDNIDGAVARASKRVTKWGSYFDYMMDKHVELIFYMAFAFAGYPIEAIIAASFNMLNSVAKPALAIRIPLGNADWPCIGERADRMFLLLGGVFLAIFYRFILGFDTISLTLITVAFVCVIGDIQRMLFAKKLIRNYERTGKKQMVRKD